MSNNSNYSNMSKYSYNNYYINKSSKSNNSKYSNIKIQDSRFNMRLFVKNIT